MGAYLWLWAVILIPRPSVVYPWSQEACLPLLWGAGKPRTLLLLLLLNTGELRRGLSLQWCALEPAAALSYGRDIA